MAGILTGPKKRLPSPFRRSARQRVFGANALRRAIVKAITREARVRVAISGRLDPSFEGRGDVMQAPGLERVTLACLCMVVGLCAAAGEARADTVADAAALLARGRADAAVALLAPLEQERAGDAGFDAALGAAWL